MQCIFGGRNGNPEDAAGKWFFSVPLSKQKDSDVTLSAFFSSYLEFVLLIYYMTVKTTILYNPDGS